MKNRLLTTALVAVMIMSVFASAGTVAAQSGDLSVAVDDGTDTVTVTSNGTEIDNASVDVTTTDDNVSYAGEGSYTTDANGTVDLPAPEENVTISVTAEANNDTATTEATLTADGDDSNESATNFGALVSEFVANQTNESNETIGLSVASFVVENNPGNAPDHAGPPSHAGPPGDDADAENESDDKQGPPEHAGQSGDDDGKDDKKGGGQPGHAGPPSDGDDDTDSDE